MKKRVCPKCGGKDIEIKPTWLQARFGFTPRVRCNDCGFESEMVAEKRDKKNDKNN